jgi:hypothetical protein
VPAVNPQTMTMPQTTIFSGSQFVQRGKKFAMDFNQRGGRRTAAAGLKTDQSWGQDVLRSDGAKFEIGCSSEGTPGFYESARQGQKKIRLSISYR